MRGDSGKGNWSRNEELREIEKDQGKIIGSWSWETGKGRLKVCEREF